MTDGQLDLGIEREGESYRTYNYATKQMSKDLTKDELNGFLRDYDQRREEYAAAERERIESEQKRKNEIAEIDNLARNSVKEYKTLSVPSQSMIRRIFREGRSQGISDSDLTMYARVSAHSGIDIQFDKEATYRGAKEDGSADYADGFYEAAKNRIVVNPEGKRTAERLLIHELDHAIRKGDNAEFRIQNAEFEATKKKIDEEYGESKRNAEYFASYSEEMLTNKHSLEKLLEAEPTLKDKILSFFKGASTDYADVPKLSNAAKKYYKTYKKLFDEFSARNYESNAISTEKSNYFSNDVSGRDYALYSNKVLDTIKKAIQSKGQLDTEYNQVQISKVTPKIAQMVKMASGGLIDISNKQIALNGDDLWHEYRRHSDAENEIGRRQIALTPDKMQQAIMAIYDPDIVETIYTTKENPVQRQSFAYAKKSSEGHYVVVEVVGGNKNPNITPTMVLEFNQDKWNEMIDSGKTLGEILYANDSKKKDALDIEYNKKNRVTAAQLSSEEVIANTPRSPRFDNSIPQPEQKSNSFDEISSENSSGKDFALDIDSDSGDISGAEVMSWLNKKPEGDAVASPVASDVDKKRITFTGSERVLENKQARLKAEYTTDKVFTQASVKRGLDKVEAVKKLPGKVKDEISRDLWLDLEASDGDEIRNAIALGYSIELFQAIRFADFERIRIKS